MIKQSALNTYLLSFPRAAAGHPFGEDVRVYYATNDSARDDDPRHTMYALIQENSNPVQLSVRCDPQLSRLLQAKYEEVLPGKNLNKRQWITIICSGQLAEDELFDLIRYSYLQVAE